MFRNFRKCISVILSLSLVAAALLPFSAYAEGTEYTVTFDYGGGEKVTRTAAEGGTVTDIPEPPEKDIIKLADGHGNSGVLIKAVYTDGALNSVTVANDSVTLTAGQTEYDLPSVNENEKYFLWDGFDGIEPLGVTDKKTAFWIYDNAEFTSETPVTGDTTVTYSYTKPEAPEKPDEPSDANGHWDFSKYTTDKAISSSEAITENYDGLEIHLGAGDSITTDGLAWTAPGSTDSGKNAAPVSNNRYIVYTPDKDGTLSVTFKGSIYASSSKAPRIYVINGTDTSCMTKVNSDNGTSATATAANRDTVASAKVNKGVTYYIWPYYYNDASCAFTVSGVLFEPAEVSISTRNIYTSNMVLQRGKPFVIDGKADAADSVTVELMNVTDSTEVQSVTVAPSSDGGWADKDWSASLNAVTDYSKEYKITVSADGAEDIVYDNVLFGDVYLFSGQSNMWKEVSYYKNLDSDDYKQTEVEKHTTDKIRVMYTQGSGDTGTAALQYNARNAQGWKDFSTYSNVSPLPAVVFTTATTLYEETDVPIGVIANAYPGSYISSWFDSALAIDACNLGKNKTSNERNWYCGRIYPLRNLELSGVFWYQGEADAAVTYHGAANGGKDANGDTVYSYYKRMMNNLIDSWRELFDTEDLPFYYVQLCRLGRTTDENNPDTGSQPETPVKLAQTDTYLEMTDKTNVGVVGTLDLFGKYEYVEGNSKSGNCRTDIHPTQKAFVGKRLAAYALKDIYNKTQYKDNTSVYTTGPMFKSAEVDGSSIVVTFDTNGQLKIMNKAQYADSETDAKITAGTIKTDELNEFEIQDAEGWHKAAAAIKGTNQVAVTADGVTEPTGVRYAYSDYPDAPNLTDDSNLPSYTFMKEGLDGGSTEPEPEEPSYEIVATYKFDFGTDTAAEGYTAVTPDMVYDMSKSDAAEGEYFGFLGTTDTSYADDVLPYDCDKRAIDGFSLVKGQQIKLTSGGTASESDADSDYIAVPKQANYLPANASAYEGRFPIRFSMKADRQSYYTVTATLTNSSETEDASASLFSEKRQIVAEDVTIKPHEKVTIKFSVDIEDIYYKVYSTNFTDDMLNISVSGENAALSSLVVEKHAKKAGKINGAASESVNDGITLWACTDSTGCDCPATVPFFALQNYAGVGQALIKYMPENIAVSNQGERGLATSDNMHFNRCNLKEGDYLYVEYGHNDDDGADAYKTRLEKYYTRAHESGAKLIIVSAINRHNTWDGEKWNSSFTKFIEAAKGFVEEKIDAGADDVAFVDLNTPYVAWMNQETARIKTINPALDEQGTMSFYYRSVKGSKVDTTHMNDAGADQGAYAFFTAAKAIVDASDDGSTDKYVLAEAEVVRPIVEGMKTKIGDTDIDNLPMTVSDEIINAGAAPNVYWDTVPSDAIEYVNSAAVADVGSETDSEGNMTISSVTMRIMNPSITYAKAVVTVSNGETVTKYYTEKNYDCTGDTAGTTHTNSGFITSDKANTDVTESDKTATITVPAGASCTVQIVACDEGTWQVGDGVVVYSAQYPVYPQTSSVFTDGIDELTVDTDTWNTNGVDGWGVLSGASEYGAIVNSEGEDDTAEKYITLTSNGVDSGGTKKNYGFFKKLDTPMNEGRYRLSFKARWDSGVARFTVSKDIQSASNPFPNKTYVLGINANGTVYTANDTANALPLTINDDDNTTTDSKINPSQWIDVDCIVNLTTGKLAVSAAGSNYVEYTISDWRSLSPGTLPINYFGVAGSGDGTATAVDMKDIGIVKLTDAAAENYTVTASCDTNKGSVTIDGENIAGKEISEGESVTLKAAAKSGYKFVSWTDGEGTVVAQSAEYTVRVFEALTLTANFEELASNETVWNFSEYGEGNEINATAAKSEEYSGLTIGLNDGDSITSSGLYWAKKGGAKSDDTTAVSNNRYIKYTAPAEGGTLRVTIKAGSVTGTTRLYLSQGTDVSCTTKNSATGQDIAKANTDTICEYTLEGGKTYFLWTWITGDSRQSTFTISNISFTAN